MSVAVTPHLHVHILHALSDNFMYLIVDTATSEAALVDPADADVAAQAALAQSVKLTAVLTTHHHFDHAGGNKEIKSRFPEIEVFGGDDVQGMTRKVTDGEQFNIGSLVVSCVHTPAHTNGHMSYMITDPTSVGAPAAIFTGDALFVGGCGRFFEGGPEQMLEGVAKLGSLPPATQVFCGHEYTIKNLQVRGGCACVRARAAPAAAAAVAPAAAAAAAATAAAGRVEGAAHHPARCRLLGSSRCMWSLRTRRPRARSCGRRARATPASRRCLPPSETS